MNASLLSICLTLVTGQTSGKDTRPPHPLAPSMPQLTEKEDARYDAIIERMIQFDAGKLKDIKDADGKKITADFQALPAEAIFNLIEGFNRAANLEASCPAVIIAKKISSILIRSDDLDLLNFAREQLGSGVTAKRHTGSLRDLRLHALLRIGEIQRRNLAIQKNLANLSVDDLVTRSEKDKGAQLKLTLTELEKRQGPKVADTIAGALQHDDVEVRRLGERLLAKHVGRQKPDQVKELLKHERKEVRLAAITDVKSRKLRLGDELIELLTDAEPAVVQAARKALVQLAKGTDHGPSPEASFGDRQTAQRLWREWWAKQTQQSRP